MTYETRLQDKWEEGCPVDTLSTKIERHFNLTREEALEYIRKANN